MVSRPHVLCRQFSGNFWHASAETHSSSVRLPVAFYPLQKAFETEEWQWSEDGWFGRAVETEKMVYSLENAIISSHLDSNVLTAGSEHVHQPTLTSSKNFLNRKLSKPRHTIAPMA